MADRNLPTPEMLRKLLSYDPETGKLFWLARPVDMFNDGNHSAAHRAANWNARRAGSEAFTAPHIAGYRQGTVLNNVTLAHRVIWAIVHDEWPTNDVDHINGVRDDNRICNLRSVTRQENMRNAARHKSNAAGVMGVAWDGTRGMWRARIMIDGRDNHLGYFTDFDAACAARKAAEVEHGFHPNHGRAA